LFVDKSIKKVSPGKKKWCGNCIIVDSAWCKFSVF
jgi:hypothetical protein